MLFRIVKLSTSLAVVVLFLVTTLNAQAKVDEKSLPQRKQKVHAIDKLPLWKVYNRYIGTLANGTPTSRLLTAYDIETPWVYDDSPSEYYYDNEKRLRKSIQRYSDPDYSHNIISYYDEEGYLCYTIDHMGNTEVETYAYLYVDKGKAVFGDMCYRSLDEDDFTRKLLAGEVLPFCLLNDYSCFFSAYHTDSIRLDYQTQERVSPLKNLPLGAKQVRFSQPKAGDTCYVNANRVYMRSQPNTSSDVMYVVDAGVLLKIVEVAGKEKIGGQEHCWYKVNMNDWSIEGGRIAYVYGAYLTPGEQVLPDNNSTLNEQKLASCKAIVDKVLNDTLRVGYILISESNDTAKLTNSEPEDPYFMSTSNAFYTFYFDMQNNIRRVVQNRAADGIVNDCYYDERGFLRYVLINQYGNSYLYGHMYADNDSVVELSVNIRWNVDDPFTHHTFCNVAIPEEYFGYKFRFYSHIDSLIKVFGIKEIPNTLKRVYLTAPSVGDIAMVMVEKTNIYSAPSSSATIADVTYSASYYTIDAIIGENMPAEDRWYEVGINYHYSKEEKKYIWDKGYIRATDLLLVENELP